MKTGQKKAAFFAGLFLSFFLLIPPGPALAAAGPTAIGTPEALDAFAGAVRAGETYAGRTVTLTADIDMTGRSFTAIGLCSGGDLSRCFQGTFDGDGHAITGLSVSPTPGSDACGFFSGLYNAAVRDLTLEVTLSASGVSAAGGLAGRTVNASVERVAVAAAVSADTWPAADKTFAVGGLLGLAEGRTTLERCAVRGSVGTAGAFTGRVYAGGLLGCLSSGGTDGRITNCYATGWLYSNDWGVYVGGLAGGLLADGGYTLLQNAYAAAVMITAGDSFVGGFSGASDGSVMLRNAYYDADLAAALPGGGNAPLPGLAGESTQRMQSADFPVVLGDAFARDSQNENGGYPVLDFQAPPGPGPTSLPIPTDVPPAPSSATPIPTDTPPAPSTESPAPTDTPPASSSATPIPTDTPPAPSSATPIPTDTPPAPSSATPIPTDTPPAPSSATPTPTGVPVAPSETPILPTEAPATPFGPSTSPTGVPAAPTVPSVSPTIAPVPPSTPAVSPTSAPILPTSTPVFPTETPALPSPAPTSPPIPASPAPPDPRIPQTGDSAHVLLWTALLCLCGAALGRLFRRTRR